MEIKQLQIQYNRSPRRTPISYLVIHDTGNPTAGADAMAHYRYFNGGNRGSSADIFVDERGVMIVNDYRRYYTWHCGDGGGAYGITNANSIGIELCINQDGNWEKTKENAICVIRSLMEELQIPLSRVVRHYDASRKKCPNSMAGQNWAEWKAFSQEIEKEEWTMQQYEEIKSQLKDLTETVGQLAVELHNQAPMIYNYIDENMPVWARPTIEKLVEKGWLKGDEAGLALDDSMLRILVMQDRAGLYDRS